MLFCISDRDGVFLEGNVGRGREEMRDGKGPGLVKGLRQHDTLTSLVNHRGTQVSAARTLPNKNNDIILWL